MRRPILVMALLATTMLLLPQMTQAQSNSGNFQALAQWAAENGRPFEGPLYAVLDGKTLIDEHATWVEWEGSVNETCTPAACSLKGGKLLLTFGDNDTLTLTIKMGVYTPTLYNKAVAFCNWHATYEVVGGTGRFSGASGLLIAQGIWTIWYTPDWRFHGRSNFEFTGTISLPKK